MHQNNMSLANYSQMSGIAKPYDFDPLNSVSKVNELSKVMYTGHNDSFVMG